MRTKKTIVLICLFFLLAAFLKATAFEATSTSFEVHGSDIESIASEGTSTSFKVRGAGGQLSTGISSSTKEVFSGILYWFYSTFTKDYQQIHYRWRNDNDNEVSASWAADEDTQYFNLAQSTNIRVRFEIANKGWTRGSGQTFLLEFASTTDCSAGSYATVPTDASLAWQISDSDNLTDGDPTTNVTSGLTDENATFIAGQVKDTGNQTSAITVTSENFTEIEFSIKATANAVGSGTYCFRLTNAGDSTGYTYTQYAKISMEAGLTCTTPLTANNFGLIDYSAVYAATTSSTTVSSGSGVYIKIYDSGSTVLPGLFKDPDLIESPWGTTTNATATLEAGMEGYGIMASTTDSNLTINTQYSYASSTDIAGGLEVGSGSAVTVASSSGAVSGGVVNIDYKASIAVTTPIGSYQDTITITCSSSP